MQLNMLFIFSNNGTWNELVHKHFMHLASRMNACSGGFVCWHFNIYHRMVIFPHILPMFLQYARIVREALCELELPYILQNVGEGSYRMSSLLQASGSLEVSYTLDDAGLSTLHMIVLLKF